MVDQVESLPKIYKKGPDCISFINTGHPLVYEFNECCLAAMPLTFSRAEKMMFALRKMMFALLKLAFNSRPKWDVIGNIVRVQIQPNALMEAYWNVIKPMVTKIYNRRDETRRMRKVTQIFG